MSPFLLLTACMSGGDGLLGFAPATGFGPAIVWDLEAKPLPEIPFPNDIATRPDGTAATGKRVNASLEAKTSFERKLRKHFSTLDGFGTFAPITIGFEKSLDLRALTQRQRGDTAFGDDAVLLLDVTPTSPTYGAASVLDFGNGSFPVLLQETDSYFANDPRERASNLLFDTYDEDDPSYGGDGDGHLDVFEDRNQDGQLDEGEDVDQDGHLDPNEDTDNDGVFDRGNLWGQGGTALDTNRTDPFADLITFYEQETDTLIFRPVYPLRERTTYAVVLMNTLVDKDGASVRSPAPFPFVHHLGQTEALRPVFEDGVLERLGQRHEDVAFAWTFTTQSVTSDLVAIREGLHGHGPRSDLAKLYPAEVTAMSPMSTESGVSAFLLRPQQIVTVLELVFQNIQVGDYDTSRVDALLAMYGAVDYVVAGDYTSVDFLTPGDGVFGAGHIPSSLRFLLVVPKPEFGAPPHPVALYCHGYTSIKLEAMLFAGVLAKFGIATFAIDAVSHGLPFGDTYQPIVNIILQELDAYGLVPFFEAIAKDRGRDLNHDGLVESGGDFWTSDTFHTRDIVRQTATDYFQAIRVLQGFDGHAMWNIDVNDNGQKDDLAGDFNADGQVDVGGPRNRYTVLGTSMGGILSSIIGGVDPAVSAAAPISPGGGLLEVGLRTDLGNVTRAVILPILGPMVITEPRPSDGLVGLKLLVNDVFAKREATFATIGRVEAGELRDELRQGDRLIVTNLTNGESDTVVVDASLRARAHVPADRQDSLVVVVERPDGTRIKEVTTFETEVAAFQGRTYAYGEPLVAIQEGLGYRRNTPDLRRLLSLAQTILEPGDPVNYGVRYRDPLNVAPEGPKARNILLTLTMGDMSVPISAGIALGRAIGVIGFTEPDPRYGITQNQLLIDYHVIEGVDERMYFQRDPCHYDARQVNFDIDDLSDGRHPAGLPRLAMVKRPPPCAALACPEACAEQPPLRAQRQDPHGISAVRFVALKPQGQHAIDLPNPELAFDPSMFSLNQIGLFLESGGTRLYDDPCLAANDCGSCTEPRCPVLPRVPAL